jgi:hypothetical protein
MHTSNLATRAELESLHGDFARDLVRQLKRGASAAVLSVIRAFLRDNHMLGLAHDDRDQKRLHRMYELYVQTLLGALQGPDKLSSAMLGEIRAFLASQDCAKSLQHGVTRAQALAALADASFPFTTTNQ